MNIYPEIDCTEAAALITAERLRQQEEEGWTRAHDDEHTAGELEEAAHCYRQRAVQILYPAKFGLLIVPAGVPLTWPWDVRWWKPTTPTRNLVKAGALLQAEVERLTRRGGYQGHLNSKVLLIRQELQKALDMEASRASNS